MRSMQITAPAVIDSVEDLDRLLPEAVQQVKSGVSAILEVRLKGSWDRP